MRAGRLRTPCRFERKTSTPDGAGGSTQTWQTIVEIKADYRPDRFVEVSAAGAVRATQSGVLQFRSCTETRVITETDRVFFDNALWNIRDIRNPDRRNRMLEAVVEKGVAQ